MLELQAPRCIRVFLWRDGLGKKKEEEKRREEEEEPQRACYFEKGDVGV